MAGMRLYDTARRSVVPFEPGPLVTIYTCGITPYDSAHLGHAATYLTFDVLRRRLADRGHETRCVRNVTDVDDDILRKARELGVHYLDLAAEEMARFDADMLSLGLLPVWSEPRATSAIPDILSLVGAALERGHAYQAGGAVYFDVHSFASFGGLSHLERPEMLQLAADRGGNPDDPNKRDPLDFVLWQPQPARRAGWESRWGPGRPGWHIECSALALRELGATVDVHGGGRDLIFPHHECENAQSESVTGQLFVRHWLHVGLVGLDGEKMSKSLGQPRLRRRPSEGMGARGRAPGAARTPLPGGLGVDASRHRGRGRPAHALARRTVVASRRRRALGTGRARGCAGPARRRPRHARSTRRPRRAAAVGGGEHRGGGCAARH